MVKNDTKEHINFSHLLKNDRGMKEILSGSILSGSGLRKKALNVSFSDCVLLYLLKGNGIFIDHKKRKYTLKPGDLAIRQPGVKTTLIREKTGEWVEFASRIPGSFYKLMTSNGTINSDITFLRPGLDTILLKNIEAFIQTFKDSEDKNGISTGYALLKGMELLLDFFRYSEGSGVKTKNQSLSMEKAKTLLSQDPHKKISLEDTARKIGMGKENFRKKFKTETGISPMNYRIKARIEKAESLLENPDIQIQETSNILGYADVSDFSRQFKKFTGFSPAEYRKRKVRLPQVFDKV